MIIDTVKGAIALIIIVALACGGFLGWQEWRDIQRERHAVAEAMVAREAAVVAETRDSLRDARGELEVALAAGRSVIGARGAASIRRPKPPPPMLVPQSIDKVDADSLRGIIGSQQRALNSLRAWGDSIEAQLVVARDTLARVLAAAERYRLYAERTIGAGERQIAAMRVVIDTPWPRRRWGVGGAGGYCALDDRRNGSVGLQHGPGVCLGVSFNF